MSITDPSLQPSTAEAASPALPLPVRPTRGTESVLVVDDDSAVRRAIVRALGRSGYTVHEADDGQSALTLLGALEAAPDMLLTDLVMPRMGGMELVAALVAQRVSMRIMLMSGYSRDRLANPEWMRGMAFLEKPFTMDVLLQCVRDVLDADAPALARPAGEA